jgi:hypothetical protein
MRNLGRIKRWGMAGDMTDRGRLTGASAHLLYAINMG